MKIRGEALTIKRIFSYIKRSVSERNKMLIFRMDINKVPKQIESGDNIKVSQIKTSELDALMRNRRPIYRQKISERLKRGDRCFVVKKKDKVCGYVWVKPKSFYFSEIRFEVELDDKSIWIYDELVFEKERGKRTLQRVLYEIFEHFKDTGYKQVYVGILNDNEPSLKAHARFGFNEKAMEIEMVKVLGIKKHNVIDYRNG